MVKTAVLHTTKMLGRVSDFYTIFGEKPCKTREKIYADFERWSFAQSASFCSSDVQAAIP